MIASVPMSMPDQKIKHIGIIGLGNQAKSWALNWRDSGLNVHCFVRNPQRSHAWAAEHQFAIHDLSELKSKSQELGLDIIALLTPDHTHRDVLREIQFLKKGTAIIYAHGYSMTRHNLAVDFGQWRHWLLAPKAIASQLRAHYLDRGPLAAFVDSGAQSDIQARDTLLWLALKLGINRGPYFCTPKQEMLADMFSEQAVLCSTLPQVAKMSYELLLKKGIPSELAFYECFYEMKLIIDAMLNRGPEAFFQMISPNAFLGAQEAQEILFDEHFHAALEKIWSELESGRSVQKIEKNLANIEDLRAQQIGQWDPQLLREFTHLK